MKRFLITWAKIFPLAMVLEALRYKTFKLWWGLPNFLIGSFVISLILIIIIHYEDLSDQLRRKRG